MTNYIERIKISRHYSLTEKMRKDISLSELSIVAAHYIKKADSTVLVVTAFLESDVVYLQFISSCKAKK
jgi:hypothetical protein